MSTEESTNPSEAVDKDYIWEICQDQFNLNILKTRGCYCFIAAVINSSGIWIVLYNTVNCTTHSITWDSRSKRILDPDINNSNVFAYNSIASFTCEDICVKLQTVFEKPCIVHTSYWKRKSPHNRKKKIARKHE